MADSGVGTAESRGRGWRLVIVLVGLGLFLYFCSRISAVINPVLIALLIAYIFDPIINWFESKKIPRWCGIAIIFMFIGAMILHMLIFAVPEAIRQASTLSYDLAGDRILQPATVPLEDQNKAPYAKADEPFTDDNENKRWDEGESFRDYNRNGIRDEGFLFEDGNNNGNYDEGYLESLSQYSVLMLERVNERIVTAGGEAIDFSSLTDRVESWVRENMQIVAKKSMDVFVDVIGVLGAGVNLVMVLLTVFMLVPFYTFYIMAEMPALQKTIVDHLPHEYRDRWLATLGRIHKAMSGFFRGMLIICMIKAVLFSLGLFIIGVPYSLVFGTLAGFGTVIPVVGVAMFMIPAVIIAGIKYGAITALMVAVLWIVVESLDGWIVNPFIMGNAVELHPMLILLAVLTGGELLGLFGMLIAVPAAAIVKIVISDYFFPHLRELATPGDS